VLVNIKLLLFDAAAPTAMAAALARKMAKSRARGKCRLPLVSIAAGYDVRHSHTSRRSRSIVMTAAPNLVAGGERAALVSIASERKPDRDRRRAAGFKLHWGDPDDAKRDRA